MFTVIGERINMTRKKIREEVWNRNAAYVTEQVHRQEAAGATHIDLNAGGDPAKETDDMIWLVETAAQATNLPFSFDSANPLAIKAGLERENRSHTIVNSITLEKERVAGILPLVVEYNTHVVALTMDDHGMPEDVDGRIRLTDEIVRVAGDAGVTPDRIYFDHLVRPASTNPGQIPMLLEAVRYTKRTYPEAHIALGLSNASYGVPGRNNLNRAFLPMLIEAGGDGAIMDPLEHEMMLLLRAARAVIGADEYCMDYLTAYREAHPDA